MKLELIRSESTLQIFFSDRCQAHQLEMSITTFGSARLKNLLQYFSRKVEIFIRQKDQLLKQGRLIKANFLRPTLFSESLDAN